MFLAKIGPAPAPALVIAGSTWYSDGTETKAGPAGTEVAADGHDADGHRHHRRPVTVRRRHFPRTIRAMRRRAVVGMCLLAVVLAAAGVGAPVHRLGRQAPATSEIFGQLPLSFEPVAGGYSARGPGYAVRLQGDGARFRLGDVPVGMQLQGGHRAAQGEGRDPLPGVVNHLTGPDPTGWRVGVPTYGRVHYAGVYDGIDVAWYGAGGNLEFDLLVAPGANPGQVVLGFDGADNVRLDAGGDLVVSVAGKELVQRRPVSYQETEQGRRPVASRYVAQGNGHYGVALGDYDSTRPLVIDPVIVYSTLLGGTAAERAEDVAVDSTGHAYVVGTTQSVDFPTAGAALPREGEFGNAVVFKLNPAGTALVYSTYLGWSFGKAIAVDSSGAAHVAGMTFSAAPLLATAQGALRGRGDAFVVKLSPSGSSLAYVTYLGGSTLDGATGIAVDSAGNAHVSGTTWSTDFPTVQPLQPAIRGESDAFVARLTPSGAVAYSTYLGGSGEDTGADIAVDPSGGAVVVGTTHSADFPTAQPAQAALLGASDAFVARLAASGSALTYSTYLGGTGVSVDGHFPPEGAFAVAVDSSSNAYVTGYTPSTDFPTHDALFPTSSGRDTFLTKMAPSGALLFSTYLRTTGVDWIGDLAVAVDGGGKVHVAGMTSGPVVQKDPLHPPRQNRDAFVMTLRADGSALLFSTNLGGDSFDGALGVAVDGSGAAYVVGITEVFGPGEPFPTKNALQPAPAGGSEMFITKISGLQAAPTIAGSTWYSDGTKAKTGPAGAELAAYGVGGVQGLAYQLVLARDGCADTVAVLNANLVRPGPSGLIGRVRGAVPLGTPPGNYEICFRHDGGMSATGVVTFVVQ
jgi:hypothetical protein